MYWEKTAPRNLEMLCISRFLWTGMLRILSTRSIRQKPGEEASFLSRHLTHVPRCCFI